MRPSGTCRLVLAMLVAAPLAACEARSLFPDAGTGAGGEGGTTIIQPLANRLSDFEDSQRAMIVQGGTPSRNGYWYAYNDATPRCLQNPQVTSIYAPAVPPTPSPLGGGLALHANWRDCEAWGAGIGADFNVPFTSALFYSGPKVPYDVGGFSGITFFARATPGLEPAWLRIKLPMRATTPIQDGGLCDEPVAGFSTCGDDWGEDFSLPADGIWRQLTVRFSDAAFKQQGWGRLFAWDPADVTGVQIQSARLAEPYDFWIDDVYLLR